MMTSSMTMVILGITLATFLLGCQAQENYSIRYTNPSISTGYSSKPTFNPRGMNHVYSITHTFLDLIQRSEVLPDSLNVSILLDTPQNNLPDLVKQHWQELLIQYMGVATASICGILIAILLPMAGLCLCCCRCAGKCGANPEHFDKRGDACKRITLGVFMSIFTIAAMFGVVTAFVTNQYGHKGVVVLPNRLQTATEDIRLYLNNTGREVNSLLVTNFAELENSLNKLLNVSGPILKHNLTQVNFPSDFFGYLFNSLMTYFYFTIIGNTKPGRSCEQ
jgi:prominin 1